MANNTRSCSESPAPAKPTPWPSSSRKPDARPWCWPTTKRSPRSSITNSKRFFPSNAVEYFVSYYDYYQPEAYLPSGDIYIEKEATINDELDKLRLSATRSLFERRDCVIVASVSCIYGLGSPEAYYGMLLMLEKGEKISRQQITSRLVDILYERNDANFVRGTFRVRGDVIEIFPTYEDNAYRIELWGDEIESLSQIDPLLGQVRQTYLRLPIYPKTHYVMTPRDPRAGIDRASSANWSGGKRSSKRAASWWRPSVSTSALCSIWK